MEVDVGSGYSFCGKLNDLVPKWMKTIHGQSSRRSEVSYLHHFCVKVFYKVINLQLQKINYHFDIVTSDLILGMTNLNPIYSFASSGENRIMKLAEYFNNKFGDNQL